jgi:hypothetical protein
MNYRQEFDLERTLAPRNVGDILRETFTIYSKNFLRLAAIVVMVQIPIAILYVAAEFIPGFGEDWGGILSSSIPSSSIPINILVGILLGLIALIAGIVMQGAMIHAISEQYFNRPVNIGRAFGFSWRRTGIMLGAQLLVLLAIASVFLIIVGVPTAIHFAAHGGVGLGASLAILVMMLIIGSPAAIYLGINWVFVLQTALLEGCGTRAALSHSSELVKGSWWRVLGILLLLILIVVAIIYAPVAIGAGIGLMASAYLPVTIKAMIWIGAIIWYVVVALITAPIITIGETLLYFDLRVRKEGYNLDFLANELGLASTPVDAGSSPPE